MFKVQFQKRENLIGGFLKVEDTLKKLRLGVQLESLKRRLRYPSPKTEL